MLNKMKRFPVTVDELFAILDRKPCRHHGLNIKWCTGCGLPMRWDSIKLKWVCWVCG